MRPSVRSACLTALVAPLIAVVGCVPPPSVRITSPPHGLFVGAAATGVQVTGAITQIDPADASVVVNGVPAQIDAAAKTFTALVPFTEQRLFQPILAEMTKVSSGKRFRDRIVVIRGAAINEAAAVPDAVALRIRQSALDEIAPVLTAVLEPQLDIEGLLPDEPIESDDGVITVLDDPPAELGSVTLALDTVSGAIDVTAVLEDLFVAARVDRDAIPRLHCEVGVSIGSLTVRTRQQLEPGGSDGETIVVQQIAASTGSEVVVTATGISSTADCSVGPGLFDDAKEKRIRERIQTELVAALADFLADPDGPSEPQAAPVAAALEAQLAFLDVGAVEVDGLGSIIEASFGAITEQTALVDVRLDVDVDLKGIDLASPSSLAGARTVVKADPNLSGSLQVASTFPVLNSRVTHDLGVGVSFSGVNRLLMSETEARRFAAVIDALETENGQEPFTAETLAAIPQFASMPPETPLRARIKATLAPVLTGNAGPHGEMLEAAVAQVVVSIARLGTNQQGQTTEKLLLKLAIDARAGLDVSLAGGALSASLGAPEPGDITITVLDNPIGADETLLEVLGPIVLTSELPKIVGTAASFPLPSFPGLVVQGTSVQRRDGYLVMFASLVPTP
ncbi:MAG: hypothetical protein AB1689_24160 [Thermodesulfobacteriota bacterium]